MAVNRITANVEILRQPRCIRPVDPLLFNFFPLRTPTNQTLFRMASCVSRLVLFGFTFYLTNPFGTGLVLYSLLSGCFRSLLLVARQQLLHA
jgi:hypothetical protein